MPVSGDVLRAWRRARGWDVPEMARRLRKAANGATVADHDALVRMVRFWESGQRRLSERYELLYAAVLGVNPDELAAGPSGDDEASRRDALKLGLTVPVAPESHILREPLPLPVAPELVDYFQAQLAGHYTADRFLGPPHLIPIATAQHGLIMLLAAGASGPIRRALWGVGTAYTALLGWLYQDTGDIRQSTHWHDVMLNAAHRTHDLQIVSWALTNAALLHADLGDGPGCLDLTGAALAPGPARLLPKVRVLALQQSAHGHSLLGGRPAVDRLLGEAGALTGQISDGYPWGNATRIPRYLDVQRATCYGRLGLWREAAAQWEDILGGTGAGAVPGRDAGVFRARHACALAGCGEPDEAVRLAAQVIPVCGHTGSSRMRRELGSLLTVMKPWEHERAGRDLAELLRPLRQSRKA